MNTKSEKRNYHCHVELTLDIIGGKWKPLILYHIGEHGVIRYGELKKEIPSINERMLTRQLRELESDQLIHREVYKQVPPKVEYYLTNIGKTLQPILLELGQWGIGYNDKTQIAEFDFE
jgi:DNA-binding HxlR family transcriptional regulator